MRNTHHNSTYRLCFCLAVVFLYAAAVGELRADDWMTWASTYTHSPQGGQRVDQYALAEQPLAPYREDFSRSGYRHFRSTLQAGQSADNLHVVEQWGRPVVPYEQWRFPFRPYAVPYNAWGPQAPYGITNGSLQLGVGGAAGAWGTGVGGVATPGGGYGTGGYGTGGYGTGGYGSGRLGDPGPGNFGNGNFGNGNSGYGPRGGNPHGGNRPNASRGFPLTPTYDHEPWYDGGYPTVPPLGAP